MILYFDNYITDTPLVKGLYSDLDRIRDSHIKYKMPGKIGISKYTLASYSVLDWSNVIIKYSLEDETKTQDFEDYVNTLFKDPIIIRGRSDTQEKFKESVKQLREFNDEWIFYAGNNDHPFMSHETQTFEKCNEMCKKYRKEHDYVSLAYSHFSESINVPHTNNPYHDIMTPDVSLIEETESCIASLYPNGTFDSIQMVNIDLIEKWFCTGNLSNRKIIRSESIMKDVSIKNQIVIIPQNEMFTHFDGYGHTARLGCPLPYEKFPPLFIPNGFFENKMKIAYGYDDYRNEWININPQKKDYCFTDSINGTDLKFGKDRLPLFWKEHIQELDINPDLDEKLNQDATNAELNLRRNPWPKSSKFNTAKCIATNRVNSILKFVPKIPTMIKNGESYRLKNHLYKFLKIK